MQINPVSEIAAGLCLELRVEFGFFFFFPPQFSWCGI